MHPVISVTIVFTSATILGTMLFAIQHYVQTARAANLLDDFLRRRRNMAEAQASVEVYDVVDGHEVNRRPAYPILAMSEYARMRAKGQVAAEVFNAKVSMFAEAASKGLASGPW